MTLGSTPGPGKTEEVLLGKRPTSAQALREVTLARLGWPRQFRLGSLRGVARPTVYQANCAD